MTRPTRDQWGMELAQVTAKRATCLRRSVGCMLVNERGHILATGYNGVSAGAKHCNEVQDDKVSQSLLKSGIEPNMHPHACPGAQSLSGTNLDGCQAIHAEQNALLQCRNVWEIHTCYVTVSPCMTCVKLLLNTSCQRIVFGELYPHTEAQDLWEKAGRVWLHLCEWE